VDVHDVDLHNVVMRSLGAHSMGMIKIIRRFWLTPID
jgi:hypothetical protein